MKIFIDYSNEQDKLAPPEDIEQLIEKCTAATLAEEDIEDDAEVSVTLVDNERIRGMNAELRLGDEEGFEVDPDTDAILLGDIVISLERANAQAEEYGHSFKREVAFLITHSLFHLLGYDHMTEDEEKEMFAKQEKVLQKLGITR